MKELQDIVNAFHTAQKLGSKTAIATVVHVEGSSYRRAGARMLITEDGQLTGAISGGCLEGDALRKARLVMTQQKPMLVMYDTNDEDDAKLGIQLGCNGIIHILIEPILPDQPNNPINFFIRFLSKRTAAVIITVFNMTNKFKPQFGTCLLIDDRGQTSGTLPDHISTVILNDALNVLQNGHTATKTYSYQHEYTCFIELLQPAIDLVIVGAGNDALPLTQMAKILGWQVTVIDGRPNYNTRERFPAADKWVIAKPEDVLTNLKPDNRTVFMLMTHNYNYDQALLKQLLPLPLAYIGVLGPKKRLDRMLAEIAGEELAVNKPEHIHGPAGLDIGSENPEQIALSILSEMQCVLNGLSAAPLKDKVVTHDREKEKTVVSHIT